ncbi:glucosyltransferase [Aliidongia dinghuensis]|uniref:Glucosyltransferase n=1 Tax=Aliidongia dinghuensis TaxID=1867774 RepID=A0A8J2YXU3_9PROT|nr:bacteriohopanetetrol glucosamine biosynthesis glycosyltransferase HpnI [Aliidongia dinghuensis]GGF38142.1 glucosyltransferase [Aliidongia dinghuensis]
MLDGFDIPGDVAIGVSLLGVAYLVVAAFAVWSFGRQRPAAPTRRPSVTILKPVCGADPGLYENLRSFCRQAYDGPVQVVIGAHRESDPAVAIARQVIADLPDADVALVIDGALPGSNFKICNLANMMAVAKHEVLVIADSDMRVEPHYLDAVVGPLMQAGVGLVTCLYKGRPERGIPSALGAAFINNGFLPSVLVGRLFGTDPGCFGATMALRRSTLDEVGGFGALINHLADDYVLGMLVRQAGYKVVIAPYVIENIVLEADMGALFRHELRWQRTIRSITPAGAAASIITNPVALALLALPVSGFAQGAWLALAAALAARGALIYTCSRMFGLIPLRAALVPIRDALSFIILVASFCGQRVTWRDQSFQVDRRGELTFEGDPLA